jgi:transposase InsO family protein
MGLGYLSIRYTQRLREARMKPTVGSAGDPYDNALAKSVIGLYKTSVITRALTPWHNLERCRICHIGVGELILITAGSLEL